MTSPTPEASDLDTIVSRTRYLLLDFDGPICSIYAGLPAVTVADRLRKLFGDHAQLPDEIGRTEDPLEVFAYAATVSEDLAARVETEMTDQELAAVATAAPTPYVHEVVTACQTSGRSVAVVSNNSSRAVHSYLARHGLDDRISLVVARTNHDPALLKPSPHLITQAVGALNAEPGECTLVGDSVTDVQAARLASVRSIGYANQPGKRERLTAAGAGATINSLADLALTLRAHVANPELLQLSLRAFFQGRTFGAPRLTAATDYASRREQPGPSRAVGMTWVERPESVGVSPLRGGSFAASFGRGPYVRGGCRARLPRQWPQLVPAATARLPRHTSRTRPSRSRQVRR
jgi:phosphoglycolate phosphatase